MHFFAKREEHRAPTRTHQAHPADVRREPVEDEMGLLDLTPRPHRDHLARHDLSWRPEDASPYDPVHVHHEVL